MDTDARFPPKLWAAKPSDLLIRTTNGAECYHRHLNDQLFYASHPNVFVLIDVLKKLQCETYIKIRGMEAEKPHREETYPVKLETQRRAGDISRLDYIQRLGFKFPAHV